MSEYTSTHGTERKRRRTVWIVAGVAAAVFLALCGFGVATISAGGEPPIGTVSGTPTGSAIPSRSPNPPAKVAPAPAPSKTPVTAATIGGDDIVHVGEDVPPGTYRAVEPIGDGTFDFCSWVKSKDAEGGDLIDAGGGAGGRPQVTLKAGQWFRSIGCPDWRKK